MTPEIFVYIFLGLVLLTLLDCFYRNVILYPLRIHNRHKQRMLIDRLFWLKQEQPELRKACDTIRNRMNVESESANIVTLRMSIVLSLLVRLQFIKVASDRFALKEVTNACQRTDEIEAIYREHSLLILRWMKLKSPIAFAFLLVFSKIKKPQFNKDLSRIVEMCAFYKSLFKFEKPLGNYSSML